MVQFDFDSDGASGPLRSGGLDGGDAIQDTLVVKDDLSNFVLPEPAQCSMAALIAAFMMISGRMLEEDGVVQSRSVAVQGCMVVPVPPLVSPEESSETGALVKSQPSVETDHLSQRFSGRDMPFGGVLSCTMRVPGVAEMMVQGATVREELLLYGVHKAMVPVLLFRRSGLDAYVAGVT